MVALLQVHRLQVTFNPPLRAENGTAETTHPPAVLHQGKAVLNGGGRVHVFGLQTQLRLYQVLIDYTNLIRLVYSREIKRFPVNRNTATVTT